MTSTFIRSLALVSMLGSAGLAHAQTPGSRDPAWSTLLQPSLPAANAAWMQLATQPSGELLVSGQRDAGAAPNEFYVARYNDDGSLDSSFGSSGRTLIPNLGSSFLTVDGTGRIYVFGARTGVVPEEPSRIVRLLPDGAIDPAFGNGQPVTTLENSSNLGLLPDGKILVVHAAPVAGSGSTERRTIGVTRLLANGSVDTSFGTNGVATLYNSTDTLSALPPEVAVMPDGSFVVGFWGLATGNVYFAQLRKYTSSGAPDTSFGNAGAVVAPGWWLDDLELQADGRLVMILRDASQGYHVARVTSRGEADSSFGVGGLASPGTGQLVDIEPDAGGGVIVGYQAGSPALLRLTPNGTIDGNFTSVPLGDDFLRDVELGTGAYVMSATPNDQVVERSVHRFLLPAEPRGGSLNTDNTPSSSDFRIDALNLTGVDVDSARAAHVVGLHGYVFPQNADVNASADLFIVVGTPAGYYMRDASGNFVAWNGMISSLVPAYENVPLRSRTYVPVYSGQLPFNGQYQLYLGYMRESGPLVYMAQPAPLVVTP